MYIEIRDDADVVEVLINRPERRNALDGEGWAAIGDAVRQQNARSGVRAILIRSTGRVFCGGADVNWLGIAPPTELGIVVDSLDALRQSPHPIVCRVQGPTFGGGIGLAAAADVVVVDPAATFTLTEVRLGIAPALISSFLIARVGSARFRTWSILGMTVDAASAHTAGLVDLVAPAGGLDVATAEVIEAIRRGEPGATASVKRVAPTGLPRDDAAALLAELRDRAAYAEGITALKSGRLPSWTTPSSGSAT